MSIYLWTEPSWSDGLLGWRPLQEDLLDASGNGYNGSWYSGTGTFSTNAGKTGARVTTNNPLSTQHVVTSLIYDDAPITIGGWICYNTMNTNNWHGLMSSSNGSGKGATMGTRPADNNYPTVGLTGGTIRIMSSTASTNTWYFWCATSDGTTLKSYNNGVLANSGSLTSYVNGGVWRLGCAMVDGGQSNNSGTDGWVRHCAVWNRVLSGDEIQEFYNQTT